MTRALITRGNFFCGIKRCALVVRAAVFSLPLLYLLMDHKIAFAEMDKADEYVLEEVIVTARRRDESMQETPVAVTAFNKDLLRTAKISNVGDVIKLVPGLYSNEGYRDAAMTIRGVGSRNGDVRADPGVGVYVDSVFIPRSDTQLLNVVNIESIQVLRGPQGTLFGKNTAGGAILINTKKPGAERAGLLELDVGDRSRQNFRAGISGPIAQKALFGGFIVDRKREDGYMEDVETGIDYGNTLRDSVLTQLRWFATATLSLDFMAFWSQQEERAVPATCVLAGNSSASLLPFTAPGETRSYSELCRYSERLAREDKVLVDRLPMPWEQTNTLLGMTLHWELGRWSLKSVSGYLGQEDILMNNDQDGTPLFSILNRSVVIRHLQGNGLNAGREKRRFLSQEFNLFTQALEDRLDFTLGLFASKEDISDNVNGQSIGPGGYLGTAIESDGGEDAVLVYPPNLVGFRGAEISGFDNSSAALFAQIIYHINETAQLAIGGRYTWEKKRVDQFNYVSGLGEFSTLSRDDFDDLRDYVQPLQAHPEVGHIEDKETWTEFSPSITLTAFAPGHWLDQTWLNSAMVYVSASEGFIAGGFSVIGSDPQSFDPETVWSYELGFKLDMYHQRVRLNAAFYYSDYKDMQLQVTRALSPVEVANGIANAGKSTINGIELELTLIPLDHWVLRLSGSYIDAEYEEFFDQPNFIGGSEGTPFVDRSNEDFIYLPEQTYSMLVQYTGILEWGEVLPSISAYYRDETNIGLDFRSPEFDSAYIDGYTIVNARIAVLPNAVAGLELAAYVNNVDDAFYYGSGVLEAGNQGASTLVRGVQRSYGVEVFYAW